jgi:hypothetical protein
MVGTSASAQQQDGARPYSTLARSGRRHRVTPQRALGRLGQQCRPAGPSRLGSGSGTPLGGAQAAQQPLQVSPGEAPGERDRGLLVAELEAKQAILDLAKVGEVVGASTLRWQIDR